MHGVITDFNPASGKISTSRKLYAAKRYPRAKPALKRKREIKCDVFGCPMAFRNRYEMLNHQSKCHQLIEIPTKKPKRPAPLKECDQNLLNYALESPKVPAVEKTDEESIHSLAPAHYDHISIIRGLRPDYIVRETKLASIFKTEEQDITQKSPAMDYDTQRDVIETYIGNRETAVASLFLSTLDTPIRVEEVYSQMQKVRSMTITVIHLIKEWFEFRKNVIQLDNSASDLRISGISSNSRENLLNSYNKSNPQYIWKGANYINKIQRDTEFCNEIPNLRPWNDQIKQSNPFLLPKIFLTQISDCVPASDRVADQIKQFLPTYNKDFARKKCISIDEIPPLLNEPVEIVKNLKDWKDLCTALEFVKDENLRSSVRNILIQRKVQHKLDKDQSLEYTKLDKDQSLEYTKSNNQLNEITSKTAKHLRVYIHMIARRFTRLCLTQSVATSANIIIFNSATLIQCIVKGFIGRKKISRMKNEKRLQVMKSATLIIQRVWRGHNARSYAIQIRRMINHERQKDAAKTISAIAKGYCFRNSSLGIMIAIELNRLRERRECEFRHRMASCISNAWRGYCARKIANKRRLAKYEMKKVRLRRLVKAKAATQIQCCYRIRLAKQLSETLKQRQLRLQSACMIQRFSRRWLAYQRIRASNAALIIQRSWKRHLAIANVRNIKREVLRRHIAASKIQSHLRGYYERKYGILARYKTQTKAALIVQQRWRLYRSTQLQIHNAVLTIQRNIRRWKAMKALDHLRAEKNSAVTIQCAYRCYTSRKYLGRKVLEVVSAIKLQCLVRMRIAKETTNTKRRKKLGECKRITEFQSKFVNHRSRIATNSGKRIYNRRKISIKQVGHFRPIVNLECYSYISTIRSENQKDWKIIKKMNKHNSFHGCKLYYISMIQILN